MDLTFKNSSSGNHQNINRHLFQGYFGPNNIGLAKIFTMNTKERKGYEMSMAYSMKYTLDMSGRTHPDCLTVSVRNKILEVTAKNSSETSTSDRKMTNADDVSLIIDGYLPLSLFFSIATVINGGTEVRPRSGKSPEFQFPLLKSMP
jgi:hypothetical protein